MRGGFIIKYTYTGTFPFRKVSDVEFDDTEKSLINAELTGYKQKTFGKYPTGKTTREVYFPDMPKEAHEVTDSKIENMLRGVSAGS
jgi:hypothetical protein